MIINKERQVICNVGGTARKRPISQSANGALLI